MQMVICPKCGTGLVLTHDFTGEKRCVCGAMLKISMSRRFESVTGVETSKWIVKVEEVKE